MNTSTPPSSPYYGGSPGQNVAEIVEQMNESDLRTILGDDGVSLITAISEPNNKLERMHRMATILLRNHANNLLFRSDIREICLNYMSSVKCVELVQRLNLSNIVALANIDLINDAATRQAYSGFFGIDVQGAVPFLKSPDKTGISPKYGLFPYQRRTMRQVCTAIRGGHGRVVLHMPTGAGKTRTAMHIVSQILLNSEPTLVVWLAASAELLEQAADAFQNAWPHLGNREIQVLRFWGEHSPELSGISDGIVIAGFQKMCALMKRDRLGLLRLGKLTGLVVVDEAHQAIAPTYKEVINILADTGKNNALLGLTATPGRTWSDIEADEQLSDYFGNRKIPLQIEDGVNPISFLVNAGYLAKPNFRRLEVEAPFNFDQKSIQVSINSDYNPEILETLSENCNRNVIILDEIRQLVDKGHKRIIFFASSVRHAELIDGVLNALDIDCRIVTANTGSTERRRIITLFRAENSKPLVLSNFGVLTTGFDAPNTSAAVIARPTKSLVLFSQMVGRAIRGPKAGGNENCTISTVVDINLPGFGDVAEAFTNWEDVWHAPN